MRRREGEESGGERLFTRGREGDFRGETEAASNKARGGGRIEFHGRSGGGMRDGGPSVQEKRGGGGDPPFFSFGAISRLLT